eukprot:m.13213 g.13213  ORF g.13213 m.13213 type:complete len:443 (-) comp9635_c0_seq1:135-1463(-)
MFKGLLLACFIAGSGVLADKCTSVLDTWCNNVTNCPNVQGCGKGQQFYALDGPASHDPESAWRCYAASNLNTNHTAYVSGTCYCSREVELKQLDCECETPGSPCTPPPPPVPSPPAPGVKILGQVFSPGLGGISCFRIPSIVQTSKGSLVAFAEARHDSCSDGAVHEIATRRSIDNGTTWQNMSFAVGGDEYYVGNPDAVATTSGRVLLVFVKHSPKCNGDCGIGNAMVYSDDDGVSWSKPVDVSSQWAQASGSLPGPGVMLETTTGRVLAVSHHSAYVDDYVTYSDDQGTTWHVVQQSFAKMDEAQMTQLSNGSLMLNMRHQQGNKFGRGTSVSHDNGITWGPIVFNAQLISPVCQGSTVTFGGVTYFSNPHSQSQRSNISVQSSSDNGNTWGNVILIWSAPSAGYTCLVKGEVGPTPNTGALVFESETGSIRLATFPINN